MPDRQGSAGASAAGGGGAFAEPVSKAKLPKTPPFLLGD
jgi:hypothetical protein